jgi:dTDP-4-dehydrorhamnose reductase
MKKKMLITGGSGLLALNWAQKEKDNFEITLGLNKREVDPVGVSTALLDFSSLESLTAGISLLKPDIIVHTAGLTSVEGCEQDTALAYTVNVELAANIARIATQLACKLVHISTDHLFTGDEPNMDETAPVSPVNVYGQTKYEAEKEVSAINPSALIIRTNFFGWGPTYRASFSDSIVQALREGRELTLFSDVYFTPILIQTLVSAVHELIDKDSSGIFNVVCDERVSKYEFGCLLAKEFGLDGTLIKAISLKSKPHLTRRPLDMSLSNRKVRATLGKPLGTVSDQLKMLHLLESDETIGVIRKLR